MMGKRSRVDAMASRAPVASPVVSSVARHTDMLRPGRSWTVTPTSPSGAPDKGGGRDKDQGGAVCTEGNDQMIQVAGK